LGIVIPPILVVIACKIAIAGPPDINAEFTHVENTKWAIENSMMQCKREEITLYDPDEGAPQPGGGQVFALHPNFSDASQCARAGIRLSMDWDESHRNTPWRVWRIGCPVPIVNMQTGEMIGYKMPDCGHRDTVVCLVDSVI